MYTVRMPPYEILKEMFPASERGPIVNGYVKPKLEPDAIMWSEGADKLLKPDRLISFLEYKDSDNCVAIIDLGVTVYPAFIEWLIEFNWQPYGTPKTLRLKEQFS